MSKISIDTPVVLILYKRPELTRLVFNRISQVKPRELFIIADGPKRENEEENCLRAREVVDSINWECEIKRNYSDINLGCRERVSSGLDWVFSQVEEAIILEDDCLPSVSFFYFCQELLRYYRDDKRVWVISGNNFQDGIERSDFSYFFSKYPLIWGWATWKRAWDEFDADLETWTDEFAMQIIRTVCEDSHEQEYRFQRFKDITQGRLDAWAPRWLFTCWANSGLSVIPKVNLVSNIGFGIQGTHTLDAKNKYANLKSHELNLINHPINHASMIYRDINADQYTYNHFFGGIKNKESRKLKNRIKRKVRRIVKLDEQ